jgi:hypothetical protein
MLILPCASNRPDDLGLHGGESPSFAHFGRQPLVLDGILIAPATPSVELAIKALGGPFRAAAITGASASA